MKSASKQPALATRISARPPSTKPVLGQQSYGKVATLIAATFASVNAHAGGLSDGTTAVTAFETWFYALAGIAAICYLVWVGVQCWSNKADWISDFGGAVAKVAAVGSVTILAPWAWSVFAA